MDFGDCEQGLEAFPARVALPERFTAEVAAGADALAVEPMTMEPAA